MERYKALQCCNPLNKPKHSVKDKKKLRNVSESVYKLFPEIKKLSKICDKCRKDIGLMSRKEEEDAYSDSSVQGLEEVTDPTFNIPNSVALEKLNTSLQELGESPVDSKKIKSKQYSAKKKLKVQ